MEIDVQVSADGIPVLMHDTTVDRTTNLTGEVRSFSYATLAAADAGAGEPVPSLDQVLDLVAGRLVVMCELKATPGDADHDRRVVDAVVEVIRRHDAVRWTAIHSFNPAMVAQAREAEPAISAAIISPPVAGEDLDRLLAATVRRGAQAVSLHFSCVTPETVRRARQRQLTVWAWTPDTEDDWRRLVEAGVSGIITNLPHRLRAFLG